MNVTEMTVSSRLFFSAVTNMLSRYVSTSCTLSQILHCCGSVKSSLAASGRDFTAVTTMNANGMRNTIATAISATASTQ